MPIEKRQIEYFYALNWHNNLFVLHMFCFKLHLYQIKRLFIVVL